MLIALEPTTRAEGLRRAMRLATALLELAAQRTELELPQAIDALGEAAERLGKRPVRDGLRAVMALTAEERAALLDAVEHDQRFDAESAESFAFSFPRLPDHVRDAAKSLFVGLYKGVLSSERGFADGHRDLTVKALWEDFHAANGDIVCPGCLIESLREPVGGSSMNDCDHFLPKKHYPLLAIHPANLVFLCPRCNLRIKGERDPLTDAASPHDRDERARTGALAGTFLPYREPAVERLAVRFATTTAPIVTVTASQEPDEARVASLVRVFALDENWAGEIRESTHDQLRVRFARGRRRPTREAVAEALERETDVIPHDVRTQKGAYLTGLYAAWLLTHKLDVFTEEVQQTWDERRRDAAGGQPAPPASAR